MTGPKIRFLTFSVVGLMATLAHYAVMFSGQAIWQAPVFWSFVGAATGAVVGYLLNYFITFASTLPHRTTTPRYILVVCLSVLLNAGLIWVLVAQLGVPLLPAQLCVTAMIFVLNFALHSQLTFSRRVS